MEQEQFSEYEMSAASQSQGPRPFGEIPGLWLKIFQMTERFFAAEAPRASGSNTIISLLILVVVNTLLSMVVSLISGSFQALMIPEFREFAPVGIGAGLVSSLCSGLCFGLLATVVGFYVSNGLTYLGARLFKGDGDYGTQTYLVSLFTAPVSIISGVLGVLGGLLMLPLRRAPAFAILFGLVSALVGLGIAIYTIILNVRAVKVTHNLGTGQAIGAIFLPGLVIFVFIACVTMVLLILLGPMIGEVFEEIVNELQYY